MTIYANKNNNGIDSRLGRIREMGIFVGIVKDNVDAQKMGRLAVFIPELGGDPNDSRSWFIVSYASPFAGATPSKDQKPDASGYNDGGGQSSYGFWMTPPDLENHVLVAFVNGDAARGYWFACLYQQNMNQMVPALASGAPNKDVDTCSAQPPVVEYNKADPQVSITQPKRAVFEPLHEALSNQGLYQDGIRGPSTASARRDSPAKVYGWITPRGHTIHVDDDEENDAIRMRTRNGAQILVSGKDGSIYAITEQGNSWLSISDVGIDAYSSKSISLRSQGSMNLHADASLNIEADGNLNLRANGDLTMQSANSMHFAANGSMGMQFGGQLSLSAGGNIDFTSGGSLLMGASGAISQRSATNARDAGMIYDNVGRSESASPFAVKVAPPRELGETVGSAPCYEQTTRRTITRRLPTHEPYAMHGVTSDVGTDEFASGDPALDPYGNPTGPAIVDQTTVGGNPAGDISNVNASDADWLAVLLYTEARGEPSDDCRAAVAQNLKNRIAANFDENPKNSSWGNSIKAYVLAYAAYSHFWADSVSTRNITAPSGSSRSQIKNGNGDWWRRAEQKGLATIQRHRNDAMFQRCKRIALEVLQGTYVGGPAFNLIKNDRKCLWYVALGSVRAPSWTQNLRTLVKLGGHTFYTRK